MRTPVLFYPGLSRLEFELDTPMTDAELEQFIRCNEPARVERFGKEMIQVMAPAGGDTSSGNVEISWQLKNWWKGHRQGRVFDSSGGFYLPDGSLLSPDASYLVQESLSRLTKGDRKGYYRICPEFVIELRSETDRRPKLEEKMERWISNGVQLGWLLDPKQKTALIYRSSVGQPEIFSGDLLLGEGPVAGFQMDLPEIWENY